MQQFIGKWIDMYKWTDRCTHSTYTNINSPPLLHFINPQVRGHLKTNTKKSLHYLLLMFKAALTIMLPGSDKNARLSSLPAPATKGRGRGTKSYNQLHVYFAYEGKINI